MKCITCKNETGSDGLKKCKRCYDKDRRNKIDNGTWKFNTKPPASLTNEQEQVLIGGLLGDLHLYRYKNHVNVGIAIGRSIKDKEYLQYQFDLFKNFCSSEIKIRSTFDKRTNKTYVGCSFRTQLAKVLSPFKNKWYPNGIKIVPRDLQLTPLICAIWFCDDGSVFKIRKNKLRLSLYTDSFIKEDVMYLQSLLLKETNVSFKITRKNSMEDLNRGFYLYTEDNAHKFINYIKPVFPLSMKRKSDVWEGLC